MRKILPVAVVAAFVLPSLALAAPAITPVAKDAVSLVQVVQDKKMDAKDDKAMTKPDTMAKEKDTKKDDMAKDDKMAKDKEMKK